MDSRISRLSRLVVPLLAFVAGAVLAAPVSADPAFVGKFGSLGVGAGQLNLPQGLAIDPSDDVLVADENSNRVDEFTTAGGFVKAWGFNVAGGGVSETCVAVCQAGTSGGVAGEFAAPVGITADTSGQVYVGENSAKVSVWTVATGAFVHAFGWGVINGGSAPQVCTAATGCGFGASGAGAGQFAAPFALAFDSGGNLFVADRSNLQIDEFTSAPLFTRAWGWGVDTGTAQFETCTTASTCQLGVSGGGAGQFGSPTGVASDGTGNVYTLDESKHRVSVFSNGGTFTKAFGWGVLDSQLKFETCTTTCVSGQGGTGAGQLNQPWGAEVDTSGNLWVADKNNHRIVEYDPNGNFRLAFGWGVKDSASAFEVCRTTCLQGINGTGDGQFATPTDVAFDSTGDIYVSDTGNNRVQRFAVGHNLDVVATGNGSVTGTGIACPTTCSNSYASGTNLTLTATPTAGSQFDGWSGACSGTGTCDLIMNFDQAATAAFSAVPSGGGGGGGGGTPPPNSGGGPVTPPPPPPVATPSAAVPPPVEFQLGNAEPVGGGTVLVEVPGSTKFVPITELTQIPVGSIVDTRKGRIRITIDIGGGKTATAEFFEGVFRFTQPRARRGLPIAKLILFGGNFKACPRVRRASAARKAKSIRHLWGSGSGPFTTVGRYASAAIRGTTWDTDDRCDGTLVKVTRGSVTVSDLTLKKSVVVKTGHQYLARAKR